MNRSILIALLLLLPASCMAQEPVGQAQPTLRPVPFGFRLFRPFYLGRLRTAKELQELQGGRWVWQANQQEQR